MIALPLFAFAVDRVGARRIHGLPRRADPDARARQLPRRARRPLGPPPHDDRRQPAAGRAAASAALRDRPNTSGSSTSSPPSRRASPRLFNPAQAGARAAPGRARSSSAPGNALMAVSENLARLIGSPLGGLAFATVGLPGVVVVDAATYVVERRRSSRSAVRCLHPSDARGRRRCRASTSSASGSTGMATIRRTHPLGADRRHHHCSASSRRASSSCCSSSTSCSSSMRGDTAVGLLRGVQAIGGRRRRPARGCAHPPVLAASAGRLGLPGSSVRSRCSPGTSTRSRPRSGCTSACSSWWASRPSRPRPARSRSCRR